MLLVLLPLRVATFLLFVLVVPLLLLLAGHLLVLALLVLTLLVVLVLLVGHDSGFPIRAASLTARAG